MFLLDSDTCLQFLDGSNPAVAERLRAQRPSDIALSSMSKAALLSRARSSGRVEENLETLRRFLEPLTILPFDDRCAEEYGQISAQLTAQGLDLPSEDLAIAATARAQDAVLVTRRTAPFNQVAGLRLANWQD